MNSITPTAIVQQVEETEQQIVDAAKAVIAREGDCKYEVGRLAHEWTQRFAKGRTDEAFAEQVGLSRVQVAQRRSVFAKFGADCNSSYKLTWTHYREAVEWNDAAEWLSAAAAHEWSVSTMKRNRAGSVADNDGSTAMSALSDSHSGGTVTGSNSADTIEMPDLPAPASATGNGSRQAKATRQNSRPIEPQAEPEQTEAQRLQHNIKGLMTQTIGSIQKDLVDADKLLGDVR